MELQNVVIVLNAWGERASESLISSDRNAQPTNTWKRERGRERKDKESVSGSSAAGQRTVAAKRMANKVTDVALFLWFCFPFAQRKQKQLQ